MTRLQRFSIVVALLGFSGTASAQMGVEDASEQWVDGVDSQRAPRQSEGPSSLEDARASGQGIRLGGHMPAHLVPPFYTVRRGDTLWDITGRYYRNPWQWPRVWSYNPEITNPHWIYPLDRVRLRPEADVQSPTDLPGPRIQIASAQRDTVESVLLRDQGYLDAEALRASGIIVGSPEEQMLLSPYDEIYIRFDDDQDVRPGMELTVFRRMSDAEREPEEQGELVRIFGTVRLRSYDNERRVGRAVITEALDPIERGYGVATMPRRFDLVDPRPNDRDLVTEVAASLRPHRLLGDHQVIFINVGGEEGVRQGNRLFVVRQGDEWRDSLDSGEENFGAHFPGSERLDEYPDEIIAEARVVNVRAHSAALVVTRSVGEVAIGDRIEMRAGY